MQAEWIAWAEGLPKRGSENLASRSSASVPRSGASQVTPEQNDAKKEAVDEMQEFHGTTVEEAVSKARAALGLTRRERFYFKVLDHGSAGLLGVGARQARIAVSEKNAPDEEDAEVTSAVTEKREPKGTVTSDGTLSQPSSLSFFPSPPFWLLIS
jgi:hypothetical protein